MGGRHVALFLFMLDGTDPIRGYELARHRQSLISLLIDNSSPFILQFWHISIVRVLGPQVVHPCAGHVRDLNITDESDTFGTDPVTGTKEKFAFAIIYTGTAHPPPSTLLGTLQYTERVFCTVTSQRIRAPDRARPK
jgi:hypothetical protein